MLVEDFKELLLFLSTYISKTPLVMGYRPTYILYSHEILSLADPLGELTLLLNIGITKFQEFSNFLFIFKLYFFKTFWNNLNSCSTSNIQEILKVFKLVAKNFESDFR